MFPFNLRLATSLNIDYDLVPPSVVSLYKPLEAKSVDLRTVLLLGLIKFLLNESECL